MRRLRLRHRLSNRSWEDFFTVLQVVGILVVLGGIFAQSYYGRRDVVASQRAQCERDSQNLAGTVNWDRITQEDNANTASTTGVPQKVRTSKARTVIEQGEIIRRFDSHIDRGRYYLLDSRLDQQIVYHGQWIIRAGKQVFIPPFRCKQAFPTPSPVQFFH